MKVFQLIISIFIAQSAGIIGSFFTAPAINTWYKDLIKPSFNPPGWLFGPVWVVLYALMGVSAYLVWQKKAAPGANFALFVYGINLLLNALWPILFFGLKQPGWAFFEIIVLWLFIAAVIYLFYKVDKLAAYLLVPYLIWVSFALILNFSIWSLN